MLNWARNEVEIACKREAPDRKEGEWDYGCACYESALKAFETLCKDEHSGFSWGLTKNILIRLMNHQCLTPIEDVPEVWNEVGKGLYQCKRMSSLFKDVIEDGSFIYTDVDRVICKEMNSDTTWTNGFSRKIVDELYPIKFPYYPPSKKFIVYMDEFLSDPINGDFDHQGFLYLITPDGEKVDFKRFYDLTGKDYIEISEEEFYKRKAGAVK